MGKLETTDKLVKLASKMGYMNFHEVFREDKWIRSPLFLCEMVILQEFIMDNYGIYICPVIKWPNNDSYSCIVMKRKEKTNIYKKGLTNGLHSTLFNGLIVAIKYIIKNKLHTGHIFEKTIIEYGKIN